MSLKQPSYRKQELGIDGVLLLPQIRVTSIITPLCLCTQHLSNYPFIKCRNFKRHKGRWSEGHRLAPQVQDLEVTSLNSYSQIEEHQAGSQENPGFCRKAWDQVHGHFPFEVRSSEFSFQPCVPFFSDLCTQSFSSSWWICSETGYLCAA